MPRDNFVILNVIDFDQNYVCSLLSVQTRAVCQRWAMDLKKNHIRSICWLQAMPRIMSNSHWVLALQPKYVHGYAGPRGICRRQLIQFMRCTWKNIVKVPKPMNWHSGKSYSPFAQRLRWYWSPVPLFFGPLRQQSMGFRLVIALFTGLGFFLFTGLLGYASLVYAPSQQRVCLAANPAWCLRQGFALSRTLEVWIVWIDNHYWLKRLQDHEKFVKFR